MKMFFETKGDFKNVEEWLTKMAKLNPKTFVQEAANQGTQALKNATPKDTGETASGWYSEVKIRGDIAEVAWKNRAHSGENVSIAKIIELGHGTGNGGYVPPNPFIKSAMDSVFNNVDSKVTKELRRN